MCGLAGLLLVLIVELVKIVSFGNSSVCIPDQQSLWVSLKSCVYFGVFQVQWINKGVEINKTKLMQIIMALLFIILDYKKGLEGLCCTSTRKVIFQQQRFILDQK